MTAETQVRFRRAAALALTAALLALAPGASAQVPNTLAYGGFLTDSAGTPYEGRVDVIAELWSGQREGTLLWGETHDGVRVSNGWFGLDLGSEEALDVDWTGTNALYLQLTINGEPIEPRQRVQSVVFAQVAENATGALATLIDEIDDRITTIERDGAGEVRWTDILNRPAGLDDGDDLLIPPIDWTDLDGIPEILEDGEIAWEEIENLPRDIEAMADDSDQLDFVGNDVFFNGVNVHVRNGQGSTTRTNGRGNLIVGYSAGGTGRQRTGSHNLIIGDEHAYAGTAGIVAGTHNDILASNASVLGGSNNTAQQPGAVVLGGNGNDAIGSGHGVRRHGERRGRSGRRGRRREQQPRRWRLGGGPRRQHQHRPGRPLGGRGGYFGSRRGRWQLHRRRFRRLRRRTQQPGARRQRQPRSGQRLGGRRRLGEPGGVRLRRGRGRLRERRGRG
jgi:hypothetical protein